MQKLNFLSGLSSNLKFDQKHYSSDKTRYGNRCGHNPLFPRLSTQLKTGMGGHPPLIHYASRKLQSYYNEPMNVFPELNFANGSLRKMRSERREAVIQAMTIMLRYYDQATGQVGIPTTCGFRHFSVYKLSSIAGLSLKRFFRALKDLKNAGFVIFKFQGIKKASIKRITKSFFKALGLSLRYAIDTAKAKKRRQKTDKQTDLERDQAASSRFINSVGAIIKTKCLKSLNNKKSQKEAVSRSKLHPVIPDISSTGYNFN